MQAAKNFLRTSRVPLSDSKIILSMQKSSIFSYEIHYGSVLLSSVFRDEPSQLFVEASCLSTPTSVGEKNEGLKVPRSTLTTPPL